MQPDESMQLGRVEADYRNKHMFWIEKRLNRRLERWFKKGATYEIVDLLADKQLNDLQIEVYSFYNKIDYRPALELSSESYNLWINRVITGWAIRKSVSVWSKIKMASLLQRQC